MDLTCYWYAGQAWHVHTIITTTTMTESILTHQSSTYQLNPLGQHRYAHNSGIITLVQYPFRLYHMVFNLSTRSITLYRNIITTAMTTTSTASQRTIYIETSRTTQSLGCTLHLSTEITHNTHQHDLAPISHILTHGLGAHTPLRGAVPFKI